MSLKNLVVKTTDSNQSNKQEKENEKIPDHKDQIFLPFVKNKEKK